MTGDLVDLAALGPDGEYRTRNRELVKDTAGVPVAESSIVPPLFVRRAIDAQRKLRPLPVEQREAALTRAADVFATSTIAGLDFDSYVVLTSRISGLPIAAARAGARTVAEALATAFDAVRPARPTGPPRLARAERTRAVARCGRGAARCSRCTPPGNAPGVHGLWPQALALGYRVAVRPSRREPFTAHRLVHALRQAGFRAGDALYLPTDHGGADEIIRSADLAMVYGGQDVVDKYASDPTVIANGPGRTKILITAERDWRDYLDVIVDSIANLGGMACVNATAVLYEGDPAPLAHAIAERLSTIEPLPTPTNGRFCPPPIERRGLWPITSRPGPPGRPRCWAPIRWSPPWATGSPRCARPCTCWPAPKPPSSTSNCRSPASGSRRGRARDGIAPLRNSLVINAITDDDELIDELVNEPTVTNVYRGRHPTYYSAPHIPHDGFLADFLMRNKGFIGG